MFSAKCQTRIMALCVRVQWGNWEIQPTTFGVLKENLDMLDRD